MKMLHILRSQPDENIKILMEASTNGDEAKVVELYREDVDWSRVVDEIFSHEKVICWW